MLHICSQWNVSTQDVLVVGDNIDDITSGREAGAGVYLYKALSALYKITVDSKLSFVTLFLQIGKSNETSKIDIFNILFKPYRRIYLLQKLIL